MIKPITALAICAFALSAFAQTQTVKVKSRGEDVRTVIDSIFDQSGKHYVLETNYHQTIYANLDGISFQKAIDIIAKIADMEFEEKEGIYYIHKKPASTAAAQPFVTPKTPAFAPAGKPIPATKPVVKPAVKPVVKTKAPAKSPNPIVKPKSTKVVTAAEAINIEEAPTTTKTQPKVNVTSRLTVQLRKMDIQEVFAEFGRQAKVEIQIDETVPSYKLDAFFYNTTLKFALDKVCKVAGLKYTFTSTNTIFITKA